MDNQFLDTKYLSEESVFLGLCVDTVVCSTEENRCISLRGTSDHVLDEISVTWSINNGPVVLWSKELLVSDVDGNSTLSLFLQSVHDIRKTKSGLTCLSGEFFVLFDNVSFDVT